MSLTITFMGLIPYSTLVGFFPSLKLNMPLLAPFGVLIGGMDLYVITQRVNPCPPKKKKNI